MTLLMQALRLERPGDVRVQDLPRPKPAESERLVQVAFCAICRTDAKMWKLGQRDLVLPRVLGHEIFGYDAQSGAPVVVWPGRACGICAACRSGAENLCPQMQVLGFHRDGGMAEWLAAPAENLLAVPAGLPGALACIAELLACSLNAWDQGGLRAGQRVLIFGGGAAGLLAALAARAAGAEPFVVECSSEKLERSAGFRLQIGLSAGLEPPSGLFDLALNAAPTPAILAQGLTYLAPGGRFVLFSGLVGEASTLAGLLNEAHYRQLHLVGAYGCTRAQMGRALTLLQAHSDAADHLIEALIPLEDVPAQLGSVWAGERLKLVVQIAGR